jgi:alkylhydroperoxidase family enzyme
MDGKGSAAMTGRVAMVSQDRANQLGEEWGMAGPRMTRSAIRTLAVNPELARSALALLSQLMERNKLDARLRELMIMRIGWVTGSAYEWTQHWRVATTVGIPPEDVLAVRDWRTSDRLTAADKAVLAATDESLAGKAISDSAWAEVAKHITDPAQQVEFVVAMGNWTMFSMLLRNLKIPVEDGVAVWPPDGKPSPAAED